jgi:hypothetical protein
MKRKKKYSLTLLEVALATSLAAVLLSVLWSTYHSWYKMYVQMQKAQSHTHKYVFVKQRLETISSFLAIPSKEEFLFTPAVKGEPPSLCFSYKAGADPDPSFNGKLRSLLYVDDAKQLCLTTWNDDKAYKQEILRDNVLGLSFLFFDPQTNLWEEEWREDLSHPPLWVKVKMKTAEGEEVIQIRTALAEGPILYLQPFQGAP